MRVVFFGTSGFAVPALVALQDSGHKVLAVVTQPPRPAGRGRRLVASQVQDAATGRGLRVLAPDNPNADQFVTDMKELSPDVGVLVAYGHILGRPLLDLPSSGFVNIHPSLLPRYRGAAPVQRALLAGETETGVSIIKMNARVDAGAILTQAPTAIEPDETCGDLSTRLAALGTQLLIRILPSLADDSVEPRAQDPALATRAPKIKEEDRLLKWAEPAQQVHNRIRALSPEPAAFGIFHDMRLLVYRSRVLNVARGARPGLILQDLPGLAVAAGEGVLELVEVKMEGGKLMDGPSFRNGARLRAGAALD